MLNREAMMRLWLVGSGSFAPLTTLSAILFRDTALMTLKARENIQSTAERAVTISSTDCQIRTGQTLHPERPLKGESGTHGRGCERVEVDARGLSGGGQEARLFGSDQVLVDMEQQAEEGLRSREHY